MIDRISFREWLKKNTDYSNKVISNQVSRMSRADSILEWVGQDAYIYFLEREPDFSKLSVSVKSQLRKSAKLYAAFHEAVQQDKACIMKQK